MASASELLDRVRGYADSASLDELDDIEFLSRHWIPKMGLFPDRNYADSLRGFSGTEGLQIWQDPLQLARFLQFLAVTKPSTYVEIGIAQGGTFIVICEYLRRVRGSSLRAMAIDIATPPEIVREYARREGHVLCTGKSSTSLEVASALDSFGAIDVAFIDGDHTYAGVKADHDLMRGRASVLAFHDVCNVFVEVPKFWEALRQANPRTTFEFIDQPSDAKHKFTSVFGIGVLLNPDKMSISLRDALKSWSQREYRQRVVVCTAAGRKKFLELQLPQMQRDFDAGDISEWALWVNTDDAGDLAYIDELAAQYTWIKKIVRTDLGGVCLRRVTHFWARGMTDPHAIYVKMDDDVVWIAGGTIRKCVNALLDDTKLGVVSPWLVNNTIAAHCMQRFGLHSRSVGFIPYSYWIRPFAGRPDWTEEIHSSFLRAAESGDLTKWTNLPDQVFTEENGHPFGIQFLVLRGSDAIRWSAMMDQRNGGDERFMTEVAPIEYGRYNKFVGGTLAVHFSYGPQTPHPFLVEAYPRYAALVVAGVK